MNYYQILQIEPGASLRDIKKAYRRLALQYHPDKNNNNTESTERFKDISIAYQVLSDPIQRSYYDHTGSADIDFDLVSSMEMFTFFFKDYDPKLLSIIEKTYGRIREELQDNQTDSLLRIIYNIEKKDIIKDAGHLAINYLSEYVQQYMNSSEKTKKNKSPDSPSTHDSLTSPDSPTTPDSLTSPKLLTISSEYTYNIDTLEPITTIQLPIEYYIHYDSLTLSLQTNDKTYPITLPTFFSNHTLTFQNTKYTFTLTDSPHSSYKRINQHDILMSCPIGLQDYIQGFQFSYNYIHTFIDIPILLSKYSSCIVTFPKYGFPINKTDCGDLVIQFMIQSNTERLYKPPLHDKYIYSTPLQDIL